MSKISKEEFTFHLMSYRPEIKRLARYLKTRRYFSYFDADDLLQDAMMSCWMRVPRNFNGDMNKLKGYCMRICFNHMWRIANRHSKDIKLKSIDWQLDFENDVENKSSEHKDVIELIKTEYKTHSSKDDVLFKVKIKDLVKLDKDFSIIEIMYENSYNRKTVTKVIGRSNSYITKLLTKIRSKVNSEDLVKYLRQKCIV